MDKLVTKRDMDRLLDLFVREHDTELSDLVNEPEDAYFKAVSPVYQICRGFPGVPTRLEDLADLIKDPEPDEWDEGRKDNSREVCALAREVLLDPEKAPMMAMRSKDGTLLRFDDDTSDTPKRYYHSRLFNNWSYLPAGSVNQTPDYRIIAEWILTL